MQLFDSSSNNFVTITEVAPSMDKYKYYYKGKEIFPQTVEQIQKLLSAQSQLREMGTAKLTLIVCKKQKINPSVIKIEDILEGGEVSSNFTQSQLEMFKAHPSSLFHNRSWSFKYAMERSGTEVSQEREEQIIQQLLSGHENWKEASLQELQRVSKNSHRIFEQTLK